MSKNGKANISRQNLISKLNWCQLAPNLSSIELGAKARIWNAPQNGTKHPFYGANEPNIQICK